MRAIEKPPSTELPSRAGDYLIEGVYGMILVVTVSGWSVAGFAVWVPLLVRTTTLLAAAVFYVTLFGNQERVLNAQRSLYFAVRFYVQGFEHFLAFYRQRHDPAPPPGLLEPLAEMKWKELMVECFWVVGVWVGMYFVFHSLVAALFGNSSPPSPGAAPGI
jgi:hypothetical protein